MKQQKQQKSRPVKAVGKHSGRRWHFKGRTVHENGSPRSHGPKGHRQADAGFMAGDTSIHALPTAVKTLSQFRVSEPTKRSHRHGIVRNATTGAEVR